VVPSEKSPNTGEQVGWDECDAPHLSLPNMSALVHPVNFDLAPITGHDDMTQRHGFRPDEA
jgi:hypothetical protein